METKLDLAADPRLLLPEVVNHILLADVLGLAADDVEAEIRSGALPGRKVGDTWLIHRQSIKAWLGALRAELEAESALSGELVDRRTVPGTGPKLVHRDAKEGGTHGS